MPPHVENDFSSTNQEGPFPHGTLFFLGIVNILIFDEFFYFDELQ